MLHFDETSHIYRDQFRCRFHDLHLSSHKIMNTLFSGSPTSFLRPQNLYLNPCVLLLLFFLLPFASSVYFRINSFTNNMASVLYEGDASPAIGALELNNADYTCRVGHVRYAERVPLWDSNSGELTDFTTHFSFFVDTQGAVNYGHGLAFFLAPVGFQIPPNSAGGFLGLFNSSNLNSSRNQIIEVEFDTNVNLQYWDPEFQHVGININSLSSSNYTAWNASLHDGDTVDATISYNATLKYLSVSWTYRTKPTFQENSSLSYQIDLRDILPEWVTVGFSAATGQYMERHVLQSWEFSSSLEMKEAGRGSSKKNKLLAGLTVSLGVLFAAGGLVAFAILRKMRRTDSESTETVNLTSINDDLERGAGPRRFSYRDLVLATNNFSIERKLGEGGFGCVYRGFLTDLDIAVAVKKISRESRQGKKEYITEVKIISSLRHRNLVQLIGWCHDQTQFLLVYEFMPNGSLDSHLFGKNAPLVWAVRYKIALGLASALLYLHEEWEQCVVHRDIKSSNIMLDSGFNVKLGDFGLARFMDHDLGPQTTGLAGTFGYMAPEYLTTGKASKESDVYSFGVVALEIATGRKSTAFVEGKSETCLVEWIWELHGSGHLFSAVDERLKSDFDARQFECLVKVGLWCAHPDRNFRPSIRQAIQVLNFETSVPNLPTAMPVPTYAPMAPSVNSQGAVITETSIKTGR